MPQLQLNKIFLGHTPVEQRKYLTALLKYLQPKYPKIVLPAVGQFTLAKCAIEAGYAKENIYTSEISLFSSLLGYLFIDKPISDLGFTIEYKVKKVWQEEYEKLETDIDRVSFLFWVMKVSQLEKISYQKLMFEELVENRRKYISEIKGTVAKMVEYFKGINY